MSDETVNTVVTDKDVRSLPHRLTQNKWLRCLGAILCVWALSYIASLFTLTAVVAIAWIIIIILVVPVGSTLTDRLLIVLLVCAAVATLIAWFTPFVPFLVSSVCITGLLGTVLAMAWGLRRTKRVIVRSQDWVSLFLGAMAAIIYGLPFIGARSEKIINVLARGEDQAAHFFLWKRVWANHGYLTSNTLPIADDRIWQTYPQGNHAILADVATTLTNSTTPPVSYDQTLPLFAALLCLQVGIFAIMATWCIDRLCRNKNISSKKVVLGQIAVVLLLVIGPGSAAFVQSSNYVTGVVLAMVAFVFTLTARTSPRFSALGLGASMIAAGAIYPVCGLLAIVLWPMYLWLTRIYWLRSAKLKWAAIICTFLFGLLYSPPFILLLLRNVDHGWETAGDFQVLNPVLFIVTMIALITVLLWTRRDTILIYGQWVVIGFFFILLLSSFYEWSKVGRISYYTNKTFYLWWMIAVIFIIAGFIRWKIGKTRAASSTLLVKSTAIGTCAVLMIGSIFVSGQFSNLDQKDPTRGWSQALSKEAWVLANANFPSGIGPVAIQLANASKDHDGNIVIFGPCVDATAYSVIKWSASLGDNQTPAKREIIQYACSGNKYDWLGKLPQYLRDNPTSTVILYTTTNINYEYLKGLKDRLQLPNLIVLPPPSGSGYSIITPNPPVVQPK